MAVSESSLPHTVKSFAAGRKLKHSGRIADWALNRTSVRHPSGAFAARRLATPFPDQERTPLSLHRTLAGACALIAALVVAAPAQARVLNVKQDFEDVTKNCETLEEVPYSYTLHAVVRTEIVDGEEVPVDIMRFDMSAGASHGVGAESGDRYVINIGTVNVTREQSNPLTLTTKFQVIDTGSGADFMVDEVFHTTFNANGELTVWHTSGGVRCGDFHDHANVKL
jgi:hypothetical protein